MADEKIIFSMVGVSKTFTNQKKVLNNIYLSFFYGAKIGIIGLNGSGKSTLMKIIAGLDKNFQGEVVFSPGYTVGYLEQEPRLDDSKTVREVVEEGCAATVALLKEYEEINMKLCEPMDDEQMARLIERQGELYEQIDQVNGWELDSVLERAMDALRCPDPDQSVKVLSGGERRRVALCRLLLQQPDVLLLDEPLGALDLKLRKEMQQELKYIQQEVGITFIFVTHDQEEALTMSDKIVVMNAGEIQQIGTPTEIYRTPVNEFVAKFIGETNIIDGVMLEDDLVMFEDKKYACRARGYNKNEKVDVVIRPEHLDIVPRAEGMLKGTVKSQLFKGMHYETVVETRVGTSITVKMQVSQDRPVYNEEKGEKISANAFLLDVEDVEELDDAKVVALASAEAWDAETEEPISIKTVEYDIKPETGNYTVTFATANDTSITVKVLVVAQNRVESKVYQEEIYAMNFFKKVEDIQESIALDTDLETWASASAWSLEDGEQVEITDVKYDFDPETITPGVYDVTFSTEGYEYKVSTTHAFEEGEQVGLVFRPEDIHVMKKEGQW